MGVVDEAVTDGVGQRGLSGAVMPLGWRMLARDDREAAVVANLENLDLGLLPRRRGEQQRAGFAISRLPARIPCSAIGLRRTSREIWTAVSTSPTRLRRDLHL